MYLTYVYDGRLIESVILSQVIKIMECHLHKVADEMRKWYLICSVLVLVVIFESIALLNLSMTYNSLDSDHASTKMEYEALKLTYEDLSVNFSGLETNHSLLQVVYQNLQENHSDIEARYRSLQSNFTSLQTAFQTLQDQYSSVLSNYSSLEESLETLETQYNSLQELYDDLQAECDRYVTAYQNLRNMMNQRSLKTDIESFTTPQNPDVVSIVYSITGGWSNSSDWNEYWSDVKAMYMWIRNNIEYRYDGLYPILPSDPADSLQHWDEMWQLPNETLSLRKGDCEDQAILLCSMIRCYCGVEYEAECVWITSSESGHVGVQIPVTEHRLVIFDPAGDYYSSDAWGNIVFNDIAVEVSNWLNYWKPMMGNDVYVYRVFSDYIDRPFTSTDEYITWMYSR